MVTKRIAAVMLILVGIVAIILGISAYDMSTGQEESDERYGGDAYTGIQRAAAQTARNVVKVAEAITFSAGSVLLIGGLAMIAGGVAILPQKEVQIEKEPFVTDEESDIEPIIVERQPKNIDHQPVRTATGWRCACGKEYPVYVSSCSCGGNKSDIH